VKRDFLLFVFRYGVRAAMPGFIAKELCRAQGVDLVFVSVNMEKYKEASSVVYKSILSAFRAYLVQKKVSSDIINQSCEKLEMTKLGGGSLDEFYFDLSEVCDNCCISYEVALGLVNHIRETIKGNTGGLTASAGIAPSFTLAKICCDVNKPDGQFVSPGYAYDDHLSSSSPSSSSFPCHSDQPRKSSTNDRPLEQGEQWLGDIPCRKIFGIGGVSDRILQAFGISALQHLQDRDNAALVYFLFTPITSSHLLWAAYGSCRQNKATNATATRLSSYQKSIGQETTFGKCDIDGYQHILLDLCASVVSEWAQIEEEHFLEYYHDDAENGNDNDRISGRQIIVPTQMIVKVKSIDFDTKSKSSNLDRDSFHCCPSLTISTLAESIVTEVSKLAVTAFAELMPMDLRLIGVRLTKFRYMEKSNHDEQRPVVTGSIDRWLVKKRELTISRHDDEEHPAASRRRIGSSAPLPNVSLDQTVIDLDELDYDDFGLRYLKPSH
jgi:nucleotidyltransferase/DNA polymerase involved in DNA repair